jgi:hypothetical protein
VRAAGEAESLEGGLAEDEAAVAEAQEKLAALEVERLEGELRAAVGEFDPKEWTKRLTALKAGISMAEKERDARREVLERTQALLAEAKADPSAGAGGAPTPGATPKLRPTAAMTGGPSFDELAFLKSVVGRTSTPSGQVPPAMAMPPIRPSKPMPAVADDAESKAAAPEPDAPAKSRATPAKAAAKVAAEPESSANGAAEAPVAESASAPIPERPSAEPESASNNAFGKPTPRTSQAVKTLKCQECGTFNYPTEWYCERCGGELAAL